jgi:hypothetical protein
MTDAVVETCLNCATPLPTPRKLREFCSYSCRGQHAVNTLTCVVHTRAYIGSKNLKKTRALHTLRKQSLGAITFCKMNSVTYRIDRRTQNGVGSFMEVAWPGGAPSWSLPLKHQRWVACVKDHRSEPLPLKEAKKAATELLQGKAAPARDHFKELNQIAANEVDRAALQRERRRWPIDLMNGRRRGFVEQRHAIIEAELAMPSENGPALQGDDYPLDYYADGYPKLPECLTRVAKPERFSDAA